MKKMMILCLSIFAFFGLVFASVPDYYLANHQFADSRDKLQGAFIKIDANTQIGTQTEKVVFLELHNNLNELMPYMPQGYDFQVIYQQCLTLSHDLSQQYTHNLFANFMQNCEKPFSNIIKQIHNKYTVKVSAKLNPSDGHAPLTVTFDARTSIDPSNETIPSDNFYRYYRNINGIDKTIGIGPVVKHTFEEAGNYKVHVTVRSSNHLSEGIFDGSKTLSIDVKPKSAIISLYANSKKLDIYNKVKFGTQEANKGIVFDALSTIPMGGREIMSHVWKIKGTNINFTKHLEGSPGVIKVPLINNGEYRVTLSVSDNELNTISDTFILIVSDPVAIIKQKPYKGNTSMTFSFDANASYSISSALKLYTWDVFDVGGNKVDTFQGKSIKKQFKQPGTYTVKLTVEDELGNLNIDTNQVSVESTEPIAQFSYKSTNEWKYPSEFVLDASLSSDLDVDNQIDTLSYQRQFSDANNTKILQTENNNQRITVAFDRVGVHTITLAVQDEYGKLSQISKEISVESILRPEIYASPQATTRGEQVNFIVKSNENILSYHRDLGDGEKRIIQTNKISHKYQKVGKYVAKLQVYGENNMENEVYQTVFIGDQNSPIPSYLVYNRSREILQPKDTCNQVYKGSTTSHPAYQINRYENFSIDPSKSVNAQGTNSNLKYYFQAQNGEIYQDNNYSYNFDELGCKFVDYTLEDEDLGKNVTQRIRFRVYNTLPELDNIILIFPQYGNQIGIGFKENYVTDIFNTEFDPLIVKVQANNARDDDGFISYFKRYYYYKDDPSRFIETKITPGNITYTFFSVPKVPGEFMFGVTMYDSDDGKKSSEELIGNGPVVFFPQDTKRPDIPMVTLRVDKTNVEVGEEVTFDVSAKIISDKSDFLTSRTIKYDFDGDGQRDHTSKSDRVKHKYSQPNELGGYSPRVAVLYRGYKGIGAGSNIIVKKGIKPALIIENMGKTVIFRDISMGDIKNTSVCFSYVDCIRGNSEFELDDPGEYFIFEYPNYGKYFISMDITDDYANTENIRQTIIITPSDTSISSGGLSVLSVPQGRVDQNGNINILVGNNLDNSILFYVKNKDPNGACYVDLDITDSTQRNFDCNKIHLQKFNPRYENLNGKIYYEENGAIASKGLEITFVDYDSQLDNELKESSDNLSKIIDDLDLSNDANKDLKVLLVNLKQDMVDEAQTQANIIALRTYLDENDEYKLSEEQITELDMLLNDLGNETMISALGGNEYEQAKSEILGVLPYNLKYDVKNLFYKFEDEYVSKDDRYVVLKDITSAIGDKVTLAGAEQKNDEISPDDMEMVIIPNLCKIAEFYDIVTQSCIVDDKNVKSIDRDKVPTEKVGISSFLKWILIIGGVVLSIFLALIIVFAIKARVRRNEDEDEE